MLAKFDDVALKIGSQEICNMFNSVNNQLQHYVNTLLNNALLVHDNTNNTNSNNNQPTNPQNNNDNMDTCVLPLTQQHQQQQTLPQSSQPQQQPQLYTHSHHTSLTSTPGFSTNNTPTQAGAGPSAQHHPRGGVGAEGPRPPAPPGQGGGVGGGFAAPHHSGGAMEGQEGGVSGMDVGVPQSDDDMEEVVMSVMRLNNETGEGW